MVFIHSILMLWVWLFFFTWKGSIDHLKQSYRLYSFSFHRNICTVGIWSHVTMQFIPHSKQHSKRILNVHNFLSFPTWVRVWPESSKINFASTIDFNFKSELVVLASTMTQFYCIYPNINYLTFKSFSIKINFHHHKTKHTVLLWYGDIGIIWKLISSRLIKLICNLFLSLHSIINISIHANHNVWAEFAFFL